MASEFAHGTYAGYQSHHREGSVPCPECRDANALYARVRRVHTSPHTLVVYGEAGVRSALRQPRVFVWGGE